MYCEREGMAQVLRIEIEKKYKKKCSVYHTKSVTHIFWIKIQSWRT